MTIGLQLVRHRRVATWCAATVLVHYLVAGWVDAGGGARLPTSRAIATVPVVVELRALDAPVAGDAAAAALVPVPENVNASAAVPKRQVQSVDAALSVELGAKVQPHYLAELPPSVELTFNLVRAGISGGAATGEAVLNWDRDAERYRLHYAAAITQPHLDNLAEMVSEGRVGTAGIVPRRMTDKRRGRARTATHFDEQGDITFSATQRAVPMPAGAQDKATWPLQLTSIARAGRAQLEAGVELLVGGDKDASVYRFVVAGQEEIVTGMGTLATWRLVRLVAPGSYNAKLEIWLAPGHEWYPVQLRSTEANGTVTTQTIRRIVAKDAGN